MIIEKLNDGYVKYKCDHCDGIFTVKLASLKRCNRLENQICKKCSIRINGSVEKRVATCQDKYGVDNPMQDKAIREKRSDDLYITQRTDFSLIKKAFESEGYQLLTANYKNRTQRLDFVCPEGHQYFITWSSWLRGSRCCLCRNKTIGLRKRHTIDFVRQSLNNEGYELLSDTYINKYIPIKYKCPEGHIGTIQFGNWISNGTRCSSCSHIESRAEVELRDFLQGYIPNIISNDRTLIKPLELDIYLPDQKIAIEYCGLYWHSEIKGKYINYHLDKLKACNKRGINLITIFEDEWINKREIVKTRLLHILGVSNTKSIHARKCTIVEIENLPKNNFLNDFHIQGSDTSSIRLGAFSGGDLVAVMTFSKGSLAKGARKSVEGVYELNRFCSDSNYHIPGIASKLLKYFIRNYNPVEIFSYSDRRWSTGDLYIKLGFNYSHDSKPSYWYILNGNRVHRFNYRKSVLGDKLENFNSQLSEMRNMFNNGFNHIWDCGNTKWILRI